MLRTTARPAATAAVSAGLVAAAAVTAVAAPALAGTVSRASGEVVRYPDQPFTGSLALAGATARVQSVETGDGRTVVTLHAAGMQPFGEYGAHVHVGSCGDPRREPDGRATAGGHYQHDRAALHGRPATDPAYANPQNEVWLDFTADREGTGASRAVVAWQFDPARRPGSVIIHERRTSPLDGGAGLRTACLDLDL